MKSLIISLLFVIAAASVFGQTSGKDSDKQPQTAKKVKESCNQFANALVIKDDAALERILSDDYRDIGLLSGFPTTKDMLMRAFKENTRAFLKTFDLNSDDSTVRVYDGTAIVTTFATADWGRKDDQKTSYMATLVMVKQKGTWHLAASHFNEVIVQESPPSKNSKPTN